MIVIPFLGLCSFVWFYYNFYKKEKQIYSKKEKTKKKLERKLKMQEEKSKGRIENIKRSSFKSSQ